MVSKQCDIAQDGVELAYKKAMRKFVRLLRRWREETDRPARDVALELDRSERSAPGDPSLTIEEARELLSSELSKSDIRALLEDRIAKTERNTLERHTTSAGG